MNIDEILRKIENGWVKAVRASPKAISLQKKVADGRGTYDDAQQLAIETGNILANMFRQYLPEALEDGKLYWETANRLITKPMLKNGALLQENLASIQEALNQKAGLGLKPIIPDMNMDQIRGIVRGVSQADQFSQVQEIFFDQVTNCMQGLVDDTVRENADFHWKAGLNPVIRRTAHGTCCTWCEAVVGTYDYADVRNKGNDVFRRHRNCRCSVEYDPGDNKGKYQNVFTKRWEDHAEVMQEAQPPNDDIMTKRDVRKEYFQNKEPYNGSIDFDDRFDHTKNTEEERMARFLHQIFGGEIQCLNHNLYQGKSPDYIWDGKLWELKTTSTVNSAEDAVRRALAQITNGENCGGIIIDIRNNDVEKTIKRAESRLKRSMHEDTDVIYVHNQTIVGIFRYEK